MINAEQARALALENAEEALKKEVNRIYGAITDTAEKGEFEVILDGKVSSNAKKMLQEDGYKLSEFSQNDDTYTTIRW